MKGNNLADVDMFTNVRSTANCNGAVSMNLFDKEGTDHVWTKFVCIRVLNEDVLANIQKRIGALGGHWCS